VALKAEEGTAKLLIDCSALEPEHGLHVERAAWHAPPAPGEGAVVYDGPSKPIVVDLDLPIRLDPEPLFYTVFATKQVGGQVVYSPGVGEPLWKAEPEALRAWAEEQAARAYDDGAWPPRVGMLLGALTAGEVAESLVESAVPRVRAWGLHRLEAGLKSSLRLSLAEPLLRRYLADPSAELRQAAAAHVWTYSETRDDALLLALIDALETPPPDVPIPVEGFLRHVGADAARVGRVLAVLEQRRPTTCALCGKPITFGERQRHLRTAHGHVDYDGDVLPADVVRERLWDRVVRQQDRAAHDRLLTLYGPGTNGADGLRHYVADVEAHVLGTLGVEGLPAALPFAAFDGYLAVLRLAEPFLAIARLMLTSDSRRVRELGREALAPVLAEVARSSRDGADALDRVLQEHFAGAELLEEKLALCQRLPALGADPNVVAASIERLQEERLVVCEECGARVRSRDREVHLRRAHGIHEFRGVRRGYLETRAALLDAGSAGRPDAKAGDALQQFAAEKQPRDPDRRLVIWVLRHLRPLEHRKRRRAIVGLTKVAAAGGRGAALLPLFAYPSKNASWQRLGQRVALELAARLPPPVGAEVLELVKPLVAARDLPIKRRMRATLGLLRTTGRSGPAAVELLRSYVSRAGKLRGLERLQELEHRFGQAPALDVVTQELEDEVRMSCPRCPTQLRRKDMVRHLWDRHRLVLDGQRVRDPWRVLEDWAVDYQLEKDPELLQRCRDLARRADADDGIARLNRLLLGHGVRDREVLGPLADRARREQASLCPHCFRSVPATEAPAPEPLQLGEQHLEGQGYRLDLSERGLVPTLRIETPSEILYAGREPHRRLTRLGGLVLLVAPLIAGSYFFLDWLTGGAFAVPLLVAVAAGVGLILTGLLVLCWPAPAPAHDRLVQAAWEMLVPELLAAPGRAGWKFLHGLAALTAGDDDNRPRPAVLVECLETAERYAGAEPHAARCLAMLCRLYIDALRGGRRDAVGFVADRVADGLRGEVSLLSAATLLEEFCYPRRGDWRRDELARLQVLVAARAFEQGLTVDDLSDLGRAFPAAEEALRLDDRWRWGQLELLWSLRDRRPWEWAGQAATVFELVAGPGHDVDALLEDHPDVLLSVRRGRLLVTTRGVWVQGECISALPDGVAVRVEQYYSDTAAEVRVGPHRLTIDGDVRKQVDELEDWLRFYFEDFLPKLPTTRRPPSDAARQLWQAHKTACPGCGKGLVPCLGDLGIAVR
jgi:hypothetical protein